MFYKLYSSLESLKVVQRYLEEVKAVMEANPPMISTAILLCDRIGTEMESVQKRLTAAGLKEINRLGDFHRHLWFIRNHPKLWRDNYSDIVDWDFPEVRKSIIDFLNSLNYVHPALRESCLFSFENENHVETIRNAFLAFKKYAVQKYNLDDNIDGAMLCDRLFSRNGVAPVGPEKTKEFHDFTKALYAYFRNKSAHYLSEISEFEAETVLMSLNLMLNYLDTTGFPC
jgi:hypothetical protein